MLQMKATKSDLHHNVSHMLCWKTFGVYYVLG